MKKKITIVGYFLLCNIIFIVDRITKHLAMMFAQIPLPIAPGLTFVYVKNRGISWGLLHASTMTVFMLTTLAITAVIGILGIYTYKRWLHNRAIVGECLVLTGAISNLLDRILYCGVIDFIEISYHDWYFPVFNIADVAIVLGVGIMFITLRQED